ncbi:MAG TPA: transglutaminase domain-containing protein [Bryobacteraceae bacterium]|nr:transglutaminase domain-containing protein [Bryobacteraceae bacterium]
MNTSDASLINERDYANRQDPSAPGLIRFRTQIAPLLKPGSPTLDTIASLRRWTRAQQSQDRALWQFPPHVDSGALDPQVLLQQQRARQPGACRRFGYVQAGALLSAQIPARIVSLQAFFMDGVGHIMVEAWVEELKKWVLVDPTHDTMFLVNGQYASLLELRSALLRGKLDSIHFERNGSNLEPSPTMAYYQQISRHAFFYTTQTLFADPPLAKADFWRFKVLHYVDQNAAPYPTFKKNALLLGTALFAVCGLLLICASVVLLLRFRGSRQDAPSQVATYS